ncbi:hypothetical protein JZ751_002179 [Albula glossodonta]|uniref:Uncharacterized protein n=1 Tax=Albula glossodonta TaxID=121402 RepID=A0A8T2P796_9TELE|nr:hypothetical protein JZ751_002179 [Albula glossodonta]
MHACVCVCVCSRPQTLMSSCGPATIPSGINLSGILPPGGLMSGGLPAMSAAPAGSPFGLSSSPGLRPVSLLQIPTGPLIFNSLQQPLSQFSPQQPGSHSAISSPLQQGEATSDQGVGGPDQVLGKQQAAVINLTGMGGFMSPQAAVLSQLGCVMDRPRPSLPAPGLQLSPALLQQHQRQQQQQIQLRLLQHQMQEQMATVAQAALARQPSTSQSRSKRKRSTPHAFSKS